MTDLQHAADDLDTDLGTDLDTASDTDITDLGAVLSEKSELFGFADAVNEAVARPVVGRLLPVHPILHQPATVLVIDADDQARQRQRTRLEEGGYHVLAAGTAVRGLDLARTRPVDAVLIDIDLADLDGWGVLSALRAVSSTAEVRVVLMSADSDALRDLACASVGADGYFEKGSADRPGDVVKIVDKLLANRFAILASLAHGGAWGTLSDIGVQTLLDGVCGTGCRGRLTVDDSTTTWQIDVDGGVIAQVRVCSAGDGDDFIEPKDRQALLGLVAVRGALWSFELATAAPERTLGVPWSRLAREVAAQVDERRARTRVALLGQPRTVGFDPARLALWLARVEPASADIATALAQGALPRDLLIDGNRAPLLVDEVLQDLIDRTVIFLRPDPDVARLRWTPSTSVRPAMQPRASSRGGRKQRGAR